MQDIEHGRNTTTTANKSFLSSLSDELIAAQETAKKHHHQPQHQLPLPKATVHRETKVADNTTGHNHAAKSSYQPREMVPARPQKTVLPKVTAAAAARSIIESAPQAQKVVESRVRSSGTVFGGTLRSGNSARPAFRAAPAQAEPRTVSYSKALHQSEQDTAEHSTISNDGNRHSSPQDTAAVPKDATVNYARIALPPISLPTTLRSLRPLPPLQLSQESSLSVPPAAPAVPTALDSARYSTVRTGEQSLIAQSITSTAGNTALKIPGTRIDASRVSETLQLAQIQQTTRLSQPQLLQTTAPMFRPAPATRNETTGTQPKTQEQPSDADRRSIAGTSFAPDPNRINVRINVRSFTAAQQVKSLLPPPAPPLHPASLSPPDTASYRMPMSNTPDEPISDNSGDNNSDTSPFNIRQFRADGSTAGDKRYTLGTDIALAALIAAAGTSRRRTESVYEESQTTTNSPYLENTGSLLKGAPIKMQAVPARLRPTMLIGGQDNLVAIAEKNFDDANLGWLIADLNRAVSNQVELNGKYLVEFESRQEVVLPVWDDIAEFYEANKGRLDNTKLITIVRQGAVDQELLETAFSPLLSQS